MSDEYLRELERRWQKSSAKPDWEAYVREQLRTGTGIVAEAAEFIGKVQTFAESIPEPAFRAVALTEVAWALLPLGRDEWALGVLSRADQARAEGSGEYEAWSQTARAYSASTVARIQGWGQSVQDAFRSVLRWVGDEPGMQEQPDQRNIDVRGTLVRWWKALGRSGVRPSEEIQAGLMVLGSYPVHHRVTVLLAAGHAFEVLGLDQEVVELVRPLLSEHGLDQVRHATRFYHHPDEAQGKFLCDTALVLARHRRGGGEADGQALLRLLRADPGLIDEFMIEAVDAHLPEMAQPPDEVCAGAITELESAGMSYEAQLLGLAPLRAWAAQAEAHRRAGELQAALERAWQYEGSPRKPRLRLLTRLLALVPGLVPPDEAIRTLEAFRQRLRTDETDNPYEEDNVLISIAQASAKMAPQPELTSLVHGLITDVDRAWTSASRLSRRFEASEVLDVFVQAQSSLGAELSGVVERAESLLDRGLDTAPNDSVAHFHLVRSKLRCAAAYEGLGLEARRDACLLRASQEHLAMQAWDSTESLLEAADLAERRWSARIAAWALEFSGRVDMSRDSRFGMELVSTLARAAVAPIREVVESDASAH